MFNNGTNKAGDVSNRAGLLYRLAEEAGQLSSGTELPFGADQDAEEREQAERDAEQR